MKSTLWIELQAPDCGVLERYGNGTGDVYSIKLRHPLLSRPRYFTRSRSGNWYSRYTGRGSNYHAEGYIIKGEL
jgi:hypothetical protein